MPRKLALLVLILHFVLLLWSCGRKWKDSVGPEGKQDDEIPIVDTWSYVYDSDFVTSLDKELAMPHGVVVTPDDRIWVGFYKYSEVLHPSEEQIFPLWIFNPDGSLFKKVQYLTWQGTIEAIKGDCRGLSLDQNGNVLFSEFDRLWRIDYKTQSALNRITPFPGVSLTEAACDQNGFIFLATVLDNDLPCNIYDTDFNYVKPLITSLKIVKRSLAASADGKDIYIGRVYGRDEQNGIFHFHSNSGPAGTYTIVDTLQKQIIANCLDFDKRGFLWAGSYWETGSGDLNGWYALDLSKKGEIVFSLGYSAGTPPAEITVPSSGTFYSPRGAAWSADGNTMYTADFDGRVIKKWTAQ